MSEVFQIHCDSHIGASCTTPLRIKRWPDGTVEIRAGGSLLGSTNMTEEEMKAVGHDPFHPEWHDNYFSGKGKTEEEALANFEKDMKHMADILWA